MTESDVKSNAERLPAIIAAGLAGLGRAVSDSADGFSTGTVKCRTAAIANRTDDRCWRLTDLDLIWREVRYWRLTDLDLIWREVRYGFEADFRR